MTMTRYGALLIFLPAMGCGLLGSTPPKPFVPPKGMKISDIQPITPSPLSPPIEFQIFAYELPITMLQDYRDLLQSLDQTSIEVQDPTGFTNNSLGAGFGKPKIGTSTVRQLESIGGEQISARSLIVFDHQGDDLASVELPQKAQVSWRDGSGVQRSQVVGAGRLSWILKSRTVREIRGVVEIRIEPGFRKKVDEIGGRMMGRIDIPIHRFPVGAFSARMGPGDFLLFGPIQSPGDETMLSSYLCRSLRNPRDRILIYLVICTRIAN
jgi:hypothetical protein